VTRALVIVVVAALASPTLAYAKDGKLPFSCPRDATSELSDSPQVVERAVLRLIPAEYASLRSMGSPAWQHAVVVGVVSTEKRLYAPQPPLRRLAVRLCGAAVADLSWTVFLKFPECQTVCSEDVALVARTPRGWRFWYTEFRHP
jgi:hypothetical protein